jgi:hypothetical protein
LGLGSGRLLAGSRISIWAARFLNSRRRRR